jgi:hypothetical protein
MDKVITTALLIVISMVLGLVLFNAAYPAIVQGGDAIASMAHREEERMKSQIAIIHTAGELDSTGQWQDTNSDGHFNTFVWIKNIGANLINPIDRTDVFFGPEGNYTRIPFQTGNDDNYPYWTWSLENASEWTPTATLKITLHFGNPLPIGRYFIKINTINGVSDETILGM